MADEPTQTSAEEAQTTHALTPAELRPTFARTFRGYDTAAVDRLLGRAAESLERLTAERETLRARVAELEGQSGDAGETQRLLRDALVSAQRVAEDLKQRAEEECEAILERARADARAIDEQAQLERERAESELERLRTQEQELRASYRVLLAAALERLEDRAEETGPPRPTLLDALAPRRVTPTNDSRERA